MVLTAVLDFLFPPHCPACDAYVETRALWCEDCLRETIRPVRLPLSTFHTAYALGAYDGVLSRLIKDLKYRGKKGVLPYLATFLHAATQEVDLPPVDFATAVPLYREKEKARGFNQAEEIFRHWLRGQEILLQRVLARTRPTKPMYGLHVRERAENLSGAFALETPEAVRGKRILLLDDIFTTGATTEACLRALAKGEPAEVSVLVLASNAGRS